MACVVLPSETARLVYGYLVKEKLDNIALQFLENSPYLTDCLHIVKSGYNFNTKFLTKELHELLQEYSIIQNIVTKKIGLLSKTSLLYKRVKLKCETLPEILDLILFWKYNLTKNETPLADDSKIKKDLNESKTEKSNETIVNNNSDNNSASVESVFQDSECGEYINSSSPSHAVIRENVNEVFEETEHKLNDNYLNVNSSKKETIINCLVENISNADIRQAVNSDAFDKYSEVENQNAVSELAKVSSEMNNDLNNVDQNCLDKSNKLEILSIPSESDVDNIDGQIKIVRIEKDNQENQEKNELQNVFSQQLDDMGSGNNIENNSVLYVTPDVGNITINQDQNQIIVIPLDYYKQHLSSQTKIETGNHEIQAQGLVDTVDKGLGPGDDIIFEDITTASATHSTPSITMPFNNPPPVKKTFVDDTILTEGTYLQNKEFIYELESKIEPQILRELEPSQPLPFTVPTTIPTVILSQAPEHHDTRYRPILPKRPKPIEVNPVVIVQPLMKGTKNAVMIRPKPNRKKTVLPKKSSSVVENTKEIRDMPSIRTPVPDREPTIKEVEETVKEIIEIVDKPNTVEEKENMMANDKQTDTPVVVVNKNSKRLSLSTPRRRSHIRALEFETPPKRRDSKKKSRTSPKSKVDEIKVKNKNVRNTLFKSPDAEPAFKTPSCLKNEQKDDEKVTESAKEDSTIKSLKTKDAAMGVAGEKTAPKKSWDSDLRDFISSCSNAVDPPISSDKKRIRKPKKKEEKKPARKENSASPRKKKTLQVIPSPSKINLTAKRNTYSISGNEEGSPVRSLLEELDLVTPFKDPEPSRSAEETPMTKLFRENIKGIDIDLSMITTPVFPPTPSIAVTSDGEDPSGACYYTPLKDNMRDKTVKPCTKIEVTTESAEEQKRKGTKETHEKVIGELVSKAKEIVGLGTESGEEHVIKKPPSGKVLSMVKIQMITQCDKKLYENIPINEEFSLDASEQQTLIETVSEELTKFDLKCELEEKRKRALKKIKSVKENLTVQTRQKKVKRPTSKRRRSGEALKSSKRSRRDESNEGKLNESSDSAKEAEMLHSTPYRDRKPPLKFDPEESAEKLDRNLLDEIREEFPSFLDEGEEFKDLPVKTRKKLHYIRHFVRSDDVVRFLERYNEKKPPRLKLKRSHRKFFQVFHKWLKHPHGREVNTSSEETKTMFKEYLNVFEKIKKGISQRFGDENGELNGEGGGSVEGTPVMNTRSRSRLSEEDGEVKSKAGTKKKEEDADDGPVSILPLKKRKATVQPLEGAESVTATPDKRKENSSRTQNFLQDIDVDRFLSQIHGQENR